MLKFSGFKKSETWKIPSIDFTQIHMYGRDGSFVDLVDQINYMSEWYRKEYQKPFFVGEYGIDGNRSDKIYDPRQKGIHIHNCLWAGLLSQSISGAMNWWGWDGYINSDKLYNRYKVFSSFIKRLDFPRKRWEKVQFNIDFESDSGQSLTNNNDIVVPIVGEWGQKDGREIVVQNNGLLKGGRLNRYLQGTNKRDIALKIKKGNSSGQQTWQNDK